MNNIMAWLLGFQIVYISLIVLGAIASVIYRKSQETIDESSTTSSNEKEE